MERTLKRWALAGIALVCLALFASITPAAAASPQSQNHPLITTPFQGTITNYANVRSGPTLHDHITTVDKPGTTVTVYAQVTGDSAWAGNVWDVVTDPSTSPLYVYSALVQPVDTGTGGGTPTPTPTPSPTPTGGGGNPPPSNQGTVTASANVRSGPTLHDAIVAVDKPGTIVTIYAQVTGDTAFAGNAWYRISATTDSPRFIYAALVQTSGTTDGGSGGPPSDSTGKLILVSISQQWLWAYQDGVQVFNTAVTTAQPGLVTPIGIYHIFIHKHPTTFYSPWPPGSPYYYPPTHINYAMEWLTGGYYIHDSYWRSVYGPGTNVPHEDPVDGWLTGTHGCVTAALDAVIWLYNWAPDGTTVQIEK